MDVGTKTDTELKIRTRVSTWPWPSVTPSGSKSQRESEQVWYFPLGCSRCALVALTKFKSRNDSRKPEILIGSFDLTADIPSLFRSLLIWILVFRCLHKSSDVTAIGSKMSADSSVIRPVNRNPEQATDRYLHMWKYLYKPQNVIYRSLNRIMWFIHRYILTADIFGSICPILNERPSRTSRTRFEVRFGLRK